MLSPAQMTDLAARLKRATDTLSLEWYLNTSLLSNNHVMRCKKTGHCVGSAILTTSKPDALSQHFLFLNPSDYELVGIANEDAVTVVGAGDGWSIDYARKYTPRLERYCDGFESIPALRALFLEAVGLTEPPDEK